jgi:DNA-binding response OmpR family regulator
MPKKVLIIEDRRENIVFIANNILKPEGYEVITARDGSMGLEKAQTEHPDVIITDLKLPVLGGLEMMEKLVEQGIHIPTIVMTFHGTEETAKQALRLGAKDYLIKPFTIDEMYEALNRALRSPAVSADPQNATPVTKLEQELARVQAALKDRETELQQIGRQLSNSVGKAEVAEIAQRAAAWEEENARLNDLLAQTKEAEGRAHALEEALLVQKSQLGKYQQEMQRLAEELNNVSQAVRLMAQDMTHQIERLEVMMPRRKSKTQH